MLGNLDHAADEDGPKSDTQADDRSDASRSRPFSVPCGFLDQSLKRARGTADVSTAIRVLGQSDVRPLMNGPTFGELVVSTSDLHIVPDLALRQHLERSTLKFSFI